VTDGLTCSACAKNEVVVLGQCVPDASTTTQVQFVATLAISLQDFEAIADEYAWAVSEATGVQRSLISVTAEEVSTRRRSSTISVTATILAVPNLLTDIVSRISSGRVQESMQSRGLPDLEIVSVNAVEGDRASGTTAISNDMPTTTTPRIPSATLDSEDDSDDEGGSDHRTALYIGIGAGIAFVLGSCLLACYLFSSRREEKHIFSQILKKPAAKPLPSMTPTSAGQSSPMGITGMGWNRSFNMQRGLLHRMESPVSAASCTYTSERSMESTSIEGSPMAGVK